MSADKRRMPRTKRRLMVRYGQPGQEPERSGITADISPGGLFVTSFKLEEVGQHLVFLVKVSDKEIPLFGRVVWRRKVPRDLHRAVKNGFGVMLTKAPEAWYQYLLEESLGGEAA